MTNVREEEELNQSSVNRSVIPQENEIDVDQNERLLSNRSLIEDDDFENEDEKDYKESLVDYNLKVSSMSNNTVDKDEDVHTLSLQQLSASSAHTKTIFLFLDTLNEG